MVSSQTKSHYQWQKEALLLHCRLQPKASKDEITGLHDNRLKIRITAPPVDGKANQHLIALISKWFGTLKGNVSIVRGEAGRQKTLLIKKPCRIPEGSEITAPKS